jgi:2-iminobutanoate/2-iminopropanoate deaminase
MKQEIRHPEKQAHRVVFGRRPDGWPAVHQRARPLDMKTGAVIGSGIAEQLAAARATFDDVVKCACHLADIHDFDEFDNLYASFFAGVRPARTTVQSGLADILVEIDAIARVRS